MGWNPNSWPARTALAAALVSSTAAGCTRGEPSGPPLYPIAGIIQEENGKTIFNGCFRNTVPDGKSIIGILKTGDLIQAPGAGSARISVELESQDEEPRRTWNVALDAFTEQNVYHPENSEGVYYRKDTDQNIMCRTELPDIMKFPDYALGHLAMVERDQYSIPWRGQAPIDQTTHIVEVSPGVGKLVTDLPGGTVDVHQVIAN
jgi:hypothetical protein